MITWMYADKIGELSSPHAEIVEALVQIAEQLSALNDVLNDLRQGDYLSVMTRNEPMRERKV